MEPRTDFAEFCERLNAHHVEFVIVGAHALAFHGAPRFTGDLDIYVAPTIENGGRVVDAIADFGFPVDALSAEGVIDRDSRVRAPCFGRLGPLSLPRTSVHPAGHLHTSR